MASPLHPFRARADLTLDEVVDAAERLLSEVAPRQTRWAVTERPDVRTVRYYTTRGLLPKPVGYDGGRARYGYAHLVRLLAIKRMQAEHMTLEQIARVLAKTDDDALAALVETAEAPALGAPQRQPRRPELTGGLTPTIEDDPAPTTDGALVLSLEPGGTLTVDARVVKDPAARARLADNLVQLARMLRATQPNADDDEGGSNA